MTAEHTADDAGFDPSVEDYVRATASAFGLDPDEAVKHLPPERTHEERVAYLEAAFGRGVMDPYDGPTRHNDTPSDADMDAAADRHYSPKERP